MKESLFYLRGQSITLGHKIVLWLFIGFSSVIYAEEKKENASTAPKVAEKATTEEDVPAELARALAAMKKYKQPKFYGAYKAGFTVFKRYNNDWFMLKKDKEKVDSNETVVFMGSLEKVRSLEKGKTYQSLISEISVDCKRKEFVIRYLDYKQGEFGTGDSIRTVSLQSDANVDGLKRSFKNKSLQDFVFSSACT